MNLEERAKYLQYKLEQALYEGASDGDIIMYESVIAELLRINEWLLEQCRVNNRVYFEADGRKYMLFKNTTGIYFRFFAMKMKVVSNSEVVDICEVTISNWKSSKWERLYLDVELVEDNIISIDANSIEYQVRSSKL